MAVNRIDNIDQSLVDTPIESPYRAQLVDFDSKLPCSPDSENPLLKNLVDMNNSSPVDTSIIQNNINNKNVGLLKTDSAQVDTLNQTCQPFGMKNNIEPAKLIISNVTDTASKTLLKESTENRSVKNVSANVKTSSNFANITCESKKSCLSNGGFIDNSIPCVSGEMFSAVKVNSNGSFDQSENVLISPNNHSVDFPLNGTLGHADISCAETHFFQNNNYNPINYNRLGLSASDTSINAAQNYSTLSSGDVYNLQHTYIVKDVPEANNRNESLSAFNTRLESKNKYIKPSPLEAYDCLQQSVVNRNIKYTPQIFFNPSFGNTADSTPNFKFGEPVYAESSFLYSFCSPEDIISTCQQKNIRTNYLNQGKEEPVPSFNKLLATENQGQVAEKAFCNCLETVYVPFEQVFTFNGQMYQLPYANVMQIGKFQFYTFLKEELVYVPLGNFIRLVGQEEKNLIVNYINMKSVAFICLSLDEIYLLEQKCSFYFDNSNRYLIDIPSLKNICFELLNICPDNITLKEIAFSVPRKLEFRSDMICSNCGLYKQCETEDNSPVPFVGNCDSTSKVTATVGYLKVGDEVFTCFELIGKWYVSFKDLVTHNIITLTALQSRMKRICSKAIIAPPSIEEYLSSHSCMVNHTLWIDMVTLRCVICMAKEVSKLATLIACGQYSYTPTSTVPCEDTSECNITYAINANNLIVVKDHTHQSNSCYTESSFFITSRRKGRASQICQSDIHSKVKSEKISKAMKTPKTDTDVQPNKLNVSDVSYCSDRIQDEGKFSTGNLEKDEDKRKNKYSMNLRPRKTNISQISEDEIYVYNKGESFSKRGKKRKKYSEQKGESVTKRKLFLNEGDYIVRDYEKFCQKIDDGLIVKRDQEEKVVGLCSEDKQAVSALVSSEAQGRLEELSTEIEQEDDHVSLLDKALNLSGINSYDFEQIPVLNDTNLGNQQLEIKDTGNEVIELESNTNVYHDNENKDQISDQENNAVPNLQEVVSERIVNESNDRELPIVSDGTCHDSQLDFIDSAMIQELEGGIVEDPNLNFKKQNQRGVSETINGNFEEIKERVEKYDRKNGHFRDSEIKGESRYIELNINTLSEKSAGIYCNKDNINVQDIVNTEEKDDKCLNMTDEVIECEFDKEKSEQNKGLEISKSIEKCQSLLVRNSPDRDENLEQREILETGNCVEVKECFDIFKSNEPEKFSKAGRCHERGECSDTFRISENQVSFGAKESHEMEEINKQEGKSSEKEERSVSKERAKCGKDPQAKAVIGRESLESGKCCEIENVSEKLNCLEIQEANLNCMTFQNEILDSSEFQTEIIAEIKSQNISQCEDSVKMRLNRELHKTRVEAATDVDTEEQTGSTFSNDATDSDAKDTTTNQNLTVLPETESQQEKKMDEKGFDRHVDIEQHTEICINEGDMKTNKKTAIQTEPETCSKDEINPENRKEWESNITKYLVFTYIKVGPKPGFRVMKFKPGAEQIFPDLFDPNLEPLEATRRLTEFKIAAGRCLDDMFTKYKQKVGKKHSNKEKPKGMESLDTNMMSDDTENARAVNVDNRETKAREMKAAKVSSIDHGDEKKKISSCNKFSEFLCNIDNNKREDWSNIEKENQDINIAKEKTDNFIPKAHDKVVLGKLDTNIIVSTQRNKKWKQKYCEKGKANLRKRIMREDTAEGNCDIHEGKEAIKVCSGTEVVRKFANEVYRNQKNCYESGQDMTEFESYKKKRGWRNLKHSQNLSTVDTQDRISVDYSEKNPYGLKRKYGKKLETKPEVKEAEYYDNNDANRKVSVNYLHEEKEQSGSNIKVSLEAAKRKSSKERDSEIRELYHIPDCYVQLRRLSFLEDAVSL